MVVHVAKQPITVPTDVPVTDSFAAALTHLRGNDGEKRMVVHAGVYAGCSLVLTKADNGLVIEAAGGEKPVLSGAVTISEWTQDAETGWFVADAPVTDFRLLLTADGRYLKKARYPLCGTLTHTSVFTAATWVGSHAGGWQRPLQDDELNHFTYNAADISPAFDAVSAEVQVFHSWNDSYCKIAKHDRASRTFWLTPNCTYPPGAWRQEYAVYNTREGMGEDGRWYCDRRTNKIYYCPFPGENVAEFSCFVPITTKIITFSEGCENITVRGLTLTAATTPVVNEPYQFPCQRGGAGFGVMEQDGAIHGTQVHGITISDTEIYNTGGYGIMLRGTSLTVRCCHIHHCGAGGIGISSPNCITPETQDDAAHSCAEDCTVTHIGLDYYGAVGIFSDSAMLRRNYVAETPYTCIIANGDYCIVEDNICINPMLALNDGACIYMHINHGCILRGNICIDRGAKRMQKSTFFGIYLDSETDGYTICNNTIRGFQRPIFDARRGGTNVWHHNFISFSCADAENDNMLIQFPIDKRVLFNDNILCAENIVIRANNRFFNPETDMRRNTAICERITIENYTQKGIPAPPDIQPYVFGGDNIINMEATTL